MDNRKINLATLPDECLYHISLFLPYTQFIYTFSLINKRLYQFVLDVTEKNCQLVPSEVIHMIASFLPAKDLCVFSLVCKEFYKISSSPILWKYLFEKDFTDEEKICREFIRLNWKQRYIKQYSVEKEKKEEQEVEYLPRRYHFKMTPTNVKKRPHFDVYTHRIGTPIVIKGTPCRITSIEKTLSQMIFRRRPWYYQSYIVSGKAFFTNEPKQMTLEQYNKVYEPILRIFTYEVIYITEDDLRERFLVLLDSEGETKEDVRLPLGKLGKKIEKAFKEGKRVLVDVLRVMEEEEVISASIEEEEEN